MPKNLLMRKSTFAVALLIAIALSCVEVLKPFEVLPPGIWRGEITLQPGVELPFNFSIEEINGHSTLIIHNDDERIKIEDISSGRNSRYQDTVMIDFALMDSYINAQFKENVLEGSWIVRNRESYSLPFRAYHGRGYRFSTHNLKPTADLTGEWKTIIEVETPTAFPAVAEFKQKNNKLTGTFRTETGDYRFLEGEIQGDEIMLSAFDGSHAFLFTGKVVNQNQLSGKFYSGSHYETNWIATREDGFDLADPFAINKITTTDKIIDFSFPNTEGKIISLSDPQYEGKAKLVMIMGTWCPNCLDESEYVLEYLANNPGKDFEVIALAFERHRDRDRAIGVIKTYKERLGIPYQILWAGSSDKKEATRALGFIDEVTAFPILLFVNKRNEVIKVHTGFSGKATSRFTEFDTKFRQAVEEILR